jgi:hypothetical protein
MLKLIFLTIFVAITSVASSQTRAATDNSRLDSLTKSYNTYSINLFVNDSVVKKAILTDVNIELRNVFPFLKHKRLKSRTTDFQINVYIQGKVVGSEQYITSSTTRSTGTYTKHTYSIDHLVNLSLAFSSNGVPLSFINVDSSVVVKRTYSYTEAISDYNWANQYDARRLQQADRQTADNARIKADEIYRFEKDFFDVFANYKNAKL